MKRDPMLARLRVGSATMVGLALGILYMDMPATLTGINERVTLLLFAMLFLSITNAIPVVIAILPELAVVRKEARNNWYSPFSWVPAKLAVETPLLVLPPAIFLAIVGNMTGLTRDEDASRFFHLYLALELVVWSVHAWSLFLCAIAPSTEIAVLLAPGSIMPMAVFSGFFVNQQDMTWVFRWFSYIDFLNYAWQAMSTAGFVGLTFEDAPPGLQTGEQVLENRLRLPSSDLEGYWRNIAFLSIFVVFFRVLSTVMISRRLVK
jgi:ABC-type multidrug transport system permease subunit